MFGAVNFVVGIINVPPTRGAVFNKRWFSLYHQPLPLSLHVQAFYMKIYKSIGIMAGPFTKQGIVVSFDWGLEELRHMIVKLRYAYSSNNVALLDELLGLP